MKSTKYIMFAHTKPFLKTKHHVLLKIRSAALRRRTTAWHVTAALSCYMQAVKFLFCALWPQTMLSLLVDMVLMHLITRSLV